jgi:hypothetical protein
MSTSTRYAFPHTEEPSWFSKVPEWMTWCWLPDAFFPAVLLFILFSWIAAEDF